MKNKYLKRIITGALVLSLVMSMTAAPTFAAKKVPAKPKVESVEYEGKGKVEVEFKGKVKYKKVKVTYKDYKGKTRTAKIKKKDNDDITFVVSTSKIKAGKSYKFTIKKIKNKKAKKYTSLTSKFYVPAPKSATKPVSKPATTKPTPPPVSLAMKEIDCDFGDRDISFEFNTRVQWSNPQVKITDSSGVSTVLPIKSYDDDGDGVEVWADNLVMGATYSYSISGVKAAGASSYTTISGTFVAYDD